MKQSHYDSHSDVTDHVLRFRLSDTNSCNLNCKIARHQKNCQAWHRLRGAAVKILSVN